MQRKTLFKATTLEIFNFKPPGKSLLNLYHNPIWRFVPWVSNLIIFHKLYFCKLCAYLVLVHDIFRNRYTVRSLTASGRREVGWWSERVRAKRCDAVDWDRLCKANIGFFWKWRQVRQFWMSWKNYLARIKRITISFLPSSI